MKRSLLSGLKREIFIKKLLLKKIVEHRLVLNRWRSEAQYFRYWDEQKHRVRK